MAPFDQLKTDTATAREALLASPVIVDCLASRVSLETYRAFLAEAYHHVRHTVPLLMACGSRLPTRLAWLQPYVVDYIAEEQGHEYWVCNDLSATGADTDSLLGAGPSSATELMVSYAYDTIARGNPVGFFGMVLVLEGTSAALASTAADIIERELGLPGCALTYLRSHGCLDQEHIGTYAEIVNRLDEASDLRALTHCAKMFYRLYADVFVGLPRAQVEPRPIGRAVA